MITQESSSDIFKQAIGLVNSTVGIELFFMMKSGSESKLILKHANIADETENSDDNTSDTLLQAYQNLINDRFSNLNDESIINLSSADDRLGAIYKFDLLEMPLQFKFMKTALDLADADNESVFNFDKDNMSDIQGLIIIIGNAENKLVLYKQNYPINLLKRDNFSLIPVPHSTRLIKLNKDILKVDINFQYIFYKNEYYIFDLKKLESLIGFDEIIKKEAKKSIEAIEKMGLLEDAQPLRDEIEDIAFSRKLTKVYKDSKVIGKVDNKVIVAFVRQHAYFKSHPIKIKENEDKLIIDTKVSKNALIKLLNDDLLYSALTRTEYESVAKNDVVE